MNEWIFILIIIVGSTLYYFYKGYLNDKELKRLSKNRGVITKAEFIYILEKKNYEAKWIGKLYDQIADYVPKHNFTMSPMDKLVDQYRIDDEDLVDLALKLFLERNGYEASKEDIKKAEKQGASILTFEGILFFITHEMHQ